MADKDNKAKEVAQQIGGEVAKKQKLGFYLLCGVAVLLLGLTMLLIFGAVSIVGTFSGTNSEGGLASNNQTTAASDEGQVIPDGQQTPCGKERFSSQSEAIAYMGTARFKVWRLQGGSKVSASASMTIQRCEVPKVEKAFSTIFNDSEKFPTYGAGGFVWRCIQHKGTPPSNCPHGVSFHASGLAIDINPEENPHVHGKKVGGSCPCTNPKPIGLKTILANGPAVRAFKSIGWKWGGEWRSSKDWMHFSSTGG